MRDPSLTLAAASLPVVFIATVGASDLPPGPLDVMLPLLGGAILASAAFGTAPLRVRVAVAAVYGFLAYHLAMSVVQMAVPAFSLGFDNSSAGITAVALALWLGLSGAAFGLLRVLDRPPEP